MTTPWDFPRTPHALHEWIRVTLGLRLARTPLVGGHNAPFDYLLHTHFEGAPIDRDPNLEPVMPSPSHTPRPGTPGPPRANPTSNGRLHAADSATLPPGHPAASPAGHLAVAPTAPGASLGHSVAASLQDSLSSRSGLPSVSSSLRLFVSSHPPDLVLWANRGGGKTFLGALATTLDLIFKPGIEVRILAGSLEQAARMFAHLRRFFESPDLASLIQGRATQRRLTLTNQSTVEILAASQASVRGTRVQKLRCDEVDLFDFDLWEAAQLTTRSGTLGGIHVRGAVECLSTMHRPHGLMFNLVKDTTTGVRRLLKWGVLDTLELCPPERPCEPCPLLPECGGRAKRSAPPMEPIAQAIDPSDTNTLVLDRSRDRLDHRPPDPGHTPIDDAITLKSRVSQAAWESEMLCYRPSRTHAVYPEFDPAIHVVADIPRAPLTWVAGMDFGFRALTVILWGAIDDQGTLWIADEHALAEAVLAEHVAAIIDGPAKRNLPIPEWVGIDPAGRQRNDQTGISNAEVLTQAGLVLRSKSAGLGESLALVRTRLKPALGPPRLRIHQRCTALIEALERYHYPDDDPESMMPVKDGPDHAADALRYLILNLDKKHTANVSSYAEGR